MTLEGNQRYAWRETLCVHFDLAQRPRAARLLHQVAARNPRLKWLHVEADEGGMFRSAVLLASDAFAGLEIRFSGGRGVLEEAARLAESVPASGAAEEVKLARLSLCDGKLEIRHYEEVVPPDQWDSESLLDPAAVLGVVQALAQLTQGIAVDPQNLALI